MVQSEVDVFEKTNKMWSNRALEGVNSRNSEPQRTRLLTEPLGLSISYKKKAWARISVSVRISEVFYKV